MNLRLACAALLICAPMLAHAQRTPILQSGTAIPSDVMKSITSGLIGTVGGLAGDALGRGVNPFSIDDGGDIGLSFNNTTDTANPYQSFRFGHDESGNAMISLRSFHGAPETDLLCDINGTVNPCFGVSPLSSLIIPDQTVLGNISGAPANPVAVPLSLLFASTEAEIAALSASIAGLFIVPDPADTYADDTSYVVVTNNSRGDIKEKIRLDTLVHHQQVHFWPVNLLPMMIDAATAGDIHQAIGSGPIIFDVSHISFGEDFIFSTQGAATAYLDIGPLGAFNGAFQGQMLRIDPNQSVTIRRMTVGIFTVVSSYDGSVGYLLANLPVGAPSGAQAYCTNCRNPGEGAGSGSGAWVTRNNTHNAWYALGVAATQ